MMTKKIKIKNNLFKSWDVFSGVFAIVGIISVFIPFSENIKNTAFGKIPLPFQIVLLLFILLSIYFLIFGVIKLGTWVYGKLKSQVYVMECDCNHSVYIQYGNIFEPKKLKKSDSNYRKNICFAVNRCFDTLVDNDLITENSLHGQAINMLIENLMNEGKSKQEAEQHIHKTIEDSLRQNGFQITETLTKGDKRKGYLERYPAGAVAEVPFGQNMFFLLGLAKFDRNLHPDINDFELISSLIGLIEHCRNRSQTYPVILPVIGGGAANTGKTTVELINCMLSIIRLYKTKINFNIYIVIDKEKSDLKSLTEFRNWE